MKVIGFIGSLRAGSYNRSLMNAFVAAKPEGVDIEIADISTFPFYNEDAEANFPEAVQAVKAKVEAADAIIIATPEYNRGMPGVLKNATDWISRPWGKNSFAGKTVYVIGASVGPISAALAQYNLKQVLTYLDAHVIGQPEFYLGNAASKFDEAGNLTDEDTKKHIEKAWSVIQTRVQK